MKRSLESLWALCQVESAPLRRAGPGRSAALPCTALALCSLPLLVALAIEAGRAFAAVTSLVDPHSPRRMGEPDAWPQFDFVTPLSLCAPRSAPSPSSSAPSSTASTGTQRFGDASSGHLRPMSRSQPCPMSPHSARGAAASAQWRRARRAPAHRREVRAWSDLARGLVARDKDAGSPGKRAAESGQFYLNGCTRRSAPARRACHRRAVEGPLRSQP